MTAHPPIRPDERGYALVSVIFLLALLALSLTIAAPKMAREIQRDREVETMERGQQYARAIKMYYKKFGAYPPSLEVLTKSGTGNIRFLRKKYSDPISGKDDWKTIAVGQNKAPTVMGFFGQPLLTGTGGVGSYAGGNINGATSAGSAFGSGSTSSPASSTTTSSGSATAGSGTATSGTTSATGSSPAAGQTFGGAGIMGFSPGVNKPALLVYKTKKRYNEWEFVYDPRSEQRAVSGGAVSGASATGSNSNYSISKPKAQ